MLMTALTVFFFTGAYDADEALKKDKARLEGEFTMVSGEIDSQPLPDAYLKGASRVSQNDETTVMIGGRLFMKAKYTIDPSKKPKTIDYLLTDGDNKGKTLLGIYELDGDTVKFCFAAAGKDRPKEFSTKGGGGTVLSVWKRAKK